MMEKGGGNPYQNQALIMKKTPSMTAGKKNPKKSNYPKASPKFKIQKKKKKEFILQKCLNSWWIHLHGRSNGDLGVFPMEEIGRTFPCVGKSNSCGMHWG